MIINEKNEKQVGSAAKTQRKLQNDIVAGIKETTESLQCF